ncbi:MAG: ABC transporter ATP-binding protein, partial [Phycisphaerales bacterium]
EPTGALDLETGRKVLGMLKKVTEELGKTVIIVTHNTAITGIADRVVRLHSGEIDFVRDNEEPLPVEEIRW